MSEQRLTSEWRELTAATGGRDFLVERVRLVDVDIAIEGRFEPPALACLSAEDQAFVAAFVQAHGSIKRMEQVFGVSYPTIKNRLNRIGDRLPRVDVAVEPARRTPPTDVLDRLETGEIDVTEALEQLRTRKANSDD